MIATKAAWAGRQVIFVNPEHTSQACSGCGAIVKKILSDRWHSCACGTELDRDTNAAVNILAAGKKRLVIGTRPRRRRLKAPVSDTGNTFTDMLVRP